MDVAEILENHPVFAKLNTTQLKALAKCVKPVDFAVGQTVFQQFQPADKFYLLRFGRILLEAEMPNRKIQKIQTLSDNDILGWSWLVPPYKWHFYAKVIEPSEALEFNGIEVKALMDQDHDLGYHLVKEFLRITVNRLQAARLQKVDIYGE